MSKKENYLIIFFAFLSLISILFLYNNYLSLSPISFVEWLNNYNYGFIRRAFFGSLISFFSKNLGLDLFILTFLTQVFFYVFFYYISLKIVLFQKKYNFIFLLVILSPLGFLYPLAELSALGRQEIIFLSFTGFFFYSLLKKRIIISQLTLLILIPVSVLTHEGVIVYLPYIFIANFFFLEKKIKINLLFIVYSLLIILLFIISLDKNILYVEIICKELSQKINNEECKNLNGITKILDYDSKALDQFLAMFKIVPVIKNIFFVILGYLPFFLIVNNKIKINIFYTKINPYLIFCICLMLTSPIFTTVDWGRWFYINYICSIYLLIFLIDKNIIEISNKAIIGYFDNLSKKIKLVIFMTFCFSWNLKLLHIDDIGSLTIYRILRKSVGLTSKLFLQ